MHDTPATPFADLIAKLEAASEGSSDLDWVLYFATEHGGPRPYTRSLDAAFLDERIEMVSLQRSRGPHEGVHRGEE